VTGEVLHPITMSPEQGAHMLDTFETWTATAIQARECILREDIVIIMPELKKDDGRVAHAKIMITGAKAAATEAVIAGRMFDFGWLPNAVIKIQATRGGPLWNQGHIEHPFSEPYVVFHQWEEGASLYVVWEVVKRETLITEFACMQSRGKKFLYASVSVGLRRFSKPGSWDARLYYPPVTQEEADTGELQASATGTVDPIATALLMLSTRGIETERIEADQKLQRARLKTRKLPIPPYWKVHTQDYVTAITTRRMKREPQGGHHASPIPHLRRGHRRHLHERHGGQVIWIADTMVMLRDGQELELPHRAFYSVKP
jgi:hypothetical protein